MIYATAEPADQDELVVVRDLIRDQLESFGIAEPDVRVEGKNIIVDLPGVVRPVQCVRRPQGRRASSSCDRCCNARPAPSATRARACPEHRAVRHHRSGRDRHDDRFVDERPATRAQPASPAVRDRCSPAVCRRSSPPRPPVRRRRRRPPPRPSRDRRPDHRADAADHDRAGRDHDCPTPPGRTCWPPPTVSRSVSWARRAAPVRSSSAAAPRPGSTRQQQWIVTVDLRGDGQEVWNTLAQQCSNGLSTCPSHQLAIVLDDVIRSRHRRSDSQLPRHGPDLRRPSPRARSVRWHACSTAARSRSRSSSSASRRCRRPPAAAHSGQPSSPAASVSPSC